MLLCHIGLMIAVAEFHALLLVTDPAYYPQPLARIS